MDIVPLHEMAPFVQQTALLATALAIGLIFAGMVLALRKPTDSLAMSFVSYGVAVLLVVAIALFAIGVIVPTLSNLFNT